MVGESSSGEITDISDVFVGQSKESVHSVDSDLAIADVVSVSICSWTSCMMTS